MLLARRAAVTAARLAANVEPRTFHGVFFARTTHGRCSCTKLGFALRSRHFQTASRHQFAPHRHPRTQNPAFDVLAALVLQEKEETPSHSSVRRVHFQPYVARASGGMLLSSHW